VARSFDSRRCHCLANRRATTKAPKLKKKNGDNQYFYEGYDANSFSFDLNANLTARLRRQQDSHCNLLSRGLYAEQLVPWLEHFELGKNLLILRYEDFKENNRQVIRKIEEFVGLTVEEQGAETASQKAYKSNRKDDQSETVRNYLAEFYRPYNAELGELLGGEWRDAWD
jgi:Sulfotransferase domain